jgi:hypothetical protein
MTDVRWLVRSPRFPELVVPARDEQHAMELVTGFRRTAARHRSRMVWEYGVHVPGLTGSYRRIGP